MGKNTTGNPINIEPRSVSECGVEDASWILMGFFLGIYSNDQVWDGMLQRLVTYKKKHESTNVPKAYAADPEVDK